MLDSFGFEDVEPDYRLLELFPNELLLYLCFLLLNSNEQNSLLHIFHIILL